MPVLGLLDAFQGLRAYAGQSRPLFTEIDIAAQPPIHFRHGKEGRFIVRSGNSPRRRKRKLFL